MASCSSALAPSSWDCVPGIPGWSGVIGSCKMVESRSWWWAASQPRRTFLQEQATCIPGCTALEFSSQPGEEGERWLLAALGLRIPYMCGASGGAEACHRAGRAGVLLLPV